MIKLALIGNAEIQKYSVADRLWELLSVVTNTDFTYSTIPLTTREDVLTFFKKFRQDKTFKGFNIAIPWKDILFDKLDNVEELVRLSSVNTIYKDDEGRVVGVNTDPLAAQKAVEAHANLYKCTSVLVIGLSGAGIPIARHMCDNLNKTTYIYDPSPDDIAEEVGQGIMRLSTLAEVATRKYDLIINATPLGQALVHGHANTFTAPLDLDILEQVTHPATIVQETNYLPSNTLLLQMAGHLGLQVVAGSNMLVFRAAESFKRYFNVSIDENTIRMLINEISAYIAERETSLLDGHEA